ncbi:glycoside hydrolase family 15 protein [Collimonas sp.]|jgi:glucoamylase|uniref:glycoside hydrolase family 15 protein n=1 Tax=Collimonas sp. TaxID=1963772 RepID=UPI002C4E8DE7|nr:glycoside hydrolase family 15 protein [Collimonas sp.]HWW08306.1 glycoside hydrolase family 15 protein [Collimonas sp.]
MNRRIRLTAMATALVAAFLSMPSAFAGGTASGGPGLGSSWAPAQKSLLGTSASNTSRVYFTGYRSIITEVFYPTLDNPNNVDLQFLVGDTAKTFVDEEKVQASYSSTQADKRSMAWTASTGNNGHNWQISKTIFVDPTRNTLIQRTTFTALNGTNVSNFNLYLLHNPSMNDAGMGDTGKTLVSGGRTLLVASKSTRASAVGVSLPWKNVGGTSMASVGFVGVNDGWTDLLGGTADKAMDYTYSLASNGNVAQMGWIDFGASTASSISFDVAIGFGATETEAMNTANATLADNLSTLRTTYDSEWHTYNNGLNTQGGTADDQYYLAAMSLKSIQDKSNGAMIAGMGTPWGETADDTVNTGGYHLVWARDLFKFANALITAGDTTSATSAISFLFNVQQQASGRFPQNSQINGTPYWNGTQMDEQAMPILLAYRLGPTVYNPIWPKIKLAANYIVANGPWTQQERWEETSGYSPSTIAAEIAGLVAASKIAMANNDTTSAATYLRTADYWQQNVAGWTYTNTGPLGNGQYYIRINPAGKSGTGSGPQIYNPTSGPDAASTFTIGNGGGSHDQRKIIDGGFLELVRMGIKSPNDSTIISTIPVYDGAIKQTVAGKGDAWFRYNFDGYGEQNDGTNYNGSSGRGRLWPIFTAERGMYEIAKSGNGSNGSSFLSAVKAFSTPEGFVSEQVWNNTASVTPGVDGGWQATTPSPYVPGSPTKSIAPLSWAMGEYINLLASIKANNVIDIPQPVCSRYNNCAIAPSAGQVQAIVNVSANTSVGQWMYVTGSTPELGSWNTDLGTPVDPGSYPIWKNKINLPASSGISYKYYRKNSDGSVTWENLPNNGNRTLTTPASGAVTLSDTVGW